MKIGDLVKHFLTEQIGVVVDTKHTRDANHDLLRVVWTTQGESLFGPGNKEWCGENQLDLLTLS